MKMNSARFFGSGFTSQRRRDAMVNTLRQRGIRNTEVLEVMRKVPRHLFVDEAISTRSYDDTALPIGCGQTISQPYIVARMSAILIEHRGSDGRPKKILEIGTGSGYQAAVLSLLVDRVITAECVESLYRRARITLRDLGYKNVDCKLTPAGKWGCPGQAPFDAILVTAATEHLPRSLLVQLAPGGLMLAPVGRVGSHQVLKAITASEDPDAPKQVKEYDQVRFVPLMH